MNVFISVTRDSVSAQALVKCPDLFSMLKQAHKAQPPLFISRVVGYTSTGLQLGDPLAPVCCALAVENCIRPISSESKIFYLDDGVLGGAPETRARISQTSPHRY